MTRPSTKPFGESLRALMDERSLTYRGLAEATRKLDGKGITHAHINMLANGHDKPSMRAMELIAAACGVDPDYFAEYRLAAAMRELDPAEVGSRAGAREPQRSTRRPATVRRQRTAIAAAPSTTSSHGVDSGSSGGSAITNASAHTTHAI